MDMTSRIFADRLAHYSTHEPKHFLRMDGNYWPGVCDRLNPTDSDGDCLQAGPTVELMYGATVRVLIPADADRDAAVRLLKKLARWLKHSPDLMQYAEPVPETGIPF